MGDTIGGAASARPVHGRGVVRAQQLGQIVQPGPVVVDPGPPPDPRPPPVRKRCRFCDKNWTLWGLSSQGQRGLIPCCVKCAPDAVRNKRVKVKRLDEGGEMPPTVSTTTARADNAAVAIRNRASSSEDERMMTNRPTPTPAPPPSLPEVPTYEWHDGDPPPVRPGPKKDTVKVDWSMLLGIASTQPGRWLKRPGTSHNAKTLAARDGFEVAYREGVLYLRAIDPTAPPSDSTSPDEVGVEDEVGEDWDGDEGEIDEGEIDEEWGEEEDDVGMDE